jgi:hypothetical protein
MVVMEADAEAMQRRPVFCGRQALLEVEFVVGSQNVEIGHCLACSPVQTLESRP